MTTNEWDRLQKQDLPDGADLLDLMGEPRPDHPGWVGIAFLGALSALDRETLAALVTPESLPAWGDFAEARDFLESIPGAGYGSTANRAIEAPDVAYSKVLANVGDGFLVTEEQIVTVGGIVSLVWRPELGGWRVHGFGGAYIPPESMPRTSPGIAPGGPS